MEIDSSTAFPRDDMESVFIAIEKSSPNGEERTNCRNTISSGNVSDGVDNTGNQPLLSVRELAGEKDTQPTLHTTAVDLPGTGADDGLRRSIVKWDAKSYRRVVRPRNLVNIMINIILNILFRYLQNGKVFSEVPGLKIVGPIIFALQDILLESLANGLRAIDDNTAMRDILRENRSYAALILGCIMIATTIAPVIIIACDSFFSKSFVLSPAVTLIATNMFNAFICSVVTVAIFVPGNLWSRHFQLNPADSAGLAAVIIPRVVLLLSIGSTASFLLNNCTHPWDISCLAFSCVLVFIVSAYTAFHKRDMYDLPCTSWLPLMFKLVMNCATDSGLIKEPVAVVLDGIIGSILRSLR